MHIDVKQAMSKLPTPEGNRFVVLFKHGTLRVKLYAPRRVDPQMPHEQDEIYVVAQGTGSFFHEGSSERFGVGDVFFVPAGDVHRFEDFSDDLFVWVFFYGPEGGEKA